MSEVDHKSTLYDNVTIVRYVIYVIIVFTYQIFYLFHTFHDHLKSSPNKNLVYYYYEKMNDILKNPIFQIIIACLIPFIGGFVSSFWTTNGIEWSQTLNKPSFNPPGWVISLILNEIKP